MSKPKVQWKQETLDNIEYHRGRNKINEQQQAIRNNSRNKSIE